MSLPAAHNVPLGDLLTQSYETTSIVANESYAEITVKLWGNGVVRRRLVDGQALAGQRRYVARKGQLILSRIDARNGALGIVPASLDGAVITNDFPVFHIAEGRIYPLYLQWLCRSPSLVTLCKRASEGSTNRVRLQVDRFLSARIPLPPYEQQIRVATALQQIEKDLTDATSLREHALADTNSLVASACRQAFAPDLPSARLSDVCAVITDGTHQTPRYVDEGKTFLSAQNVKPFRFMPERHRKVSEDDFRIYVAKTKPMRGDVLLTRVGAGIGEAAVVDRAIDFAIYVSLALLRPDPNRLLSDFLVYWLNSPAGREHSQRDTLGKGHSQGNLNLKLLRAFTVPVPSLEEQRGIVTALDNVRLEAEKLKQIQIATRDEIAAMLPVVLSAIFETSW